MCLPLATDPGHVHAAATLADIQRQLDDAAEHNATKERELAAAMSEAEAVKQQAQAADAKHAAEEQRLSEVCQRRCCLAPIPYSMELIRAAG